MITLIIIILIICLICAFKKDKHNKMEDDAAISRIPPFTVYARPMSAMSKFLNFAVSKSELLHSFSYSDGMVTIVMQNGQSLTYPLNLLSVRFDKCNGTVYYTLKSDRQKVSFYYTTNITNAEWDAINNVLCLAGTTYGRSIFSKQYKYLGYANTAIKAIKALS